MPNVNPCPHCGSFNRPEAERCHSCGRTLDATRETAPDGSNVLLTRVMGGEVYNALHGSEGKRRVSAPRQETPAAAAVPVSETEEMPIEDNSDVIGAAVGRIRTKAHEEGHRFKPYVRSKARKAPADGGQEELATNLDLAVALLRERRFEEAIEPILKTIARDDENRRPWILLGEAYLRADRPYKAAVAYLRALELSPKDEQAWLGLGRVLRSLDELPTSAEVLARATRINPEHADTWTERGLVLVSLQKFPDALRSFGKALDIRPDHRVALAKRAEVEGMMRGQGATEREPAPTPPHPPAPGPATTAEEPVLEDDILEGMEETLDRATLGTHGPATAVAKPVPVQKPGASSRPARVRTFVDGLDDTLDNGIPWGHVVLIEGAPGTMKSSLAFSILLHNAAREGLHCLYLSLEERASSLLKQMGSLGLKLEVPKGSLIVLDPRTASNIFGEKGDWVEALEKGIRSIKEQRGLDLIVIDSLEALEVLARFKDRRREMYRLFEWLRDLGVTSFVVTERPDWLIAGHVLQGRWDEDFLADAVLHLRLHMVSDLEAQRRLRVVKMRGSKHETGYLAMVLDDGGFRVTRAMSP